jgi:hypothetical protein
VSKIEVRIKRSVNVVLSEEIEGTVEIAKRFVSSVQSLPFRLHSTQTTFPPKLRIG